MKHILRKILPLALALALLLSLAPAALAAEVTVELLPTLEIDVNESKQLTATVKFNPGEETLEAAEDEKPAVTWTAAEGTGKVTLSETTTEIGENGESTNTVTGEKAGTARISATCGGVTVYCAVTVNAVTIPVTSLTLSDTSLNFQMGLTESLTATVEPSNATSRTVTWTVTEGQGNVSLSKISPNMTTTEAGEPVTVTAVRSGTAKISASCGNETVDCNVTITDVKIDATRYMIDGQMKFDDESLLKDLKDRCLNITGSSLSYLSNISVKTETGTLYEGYVSEAVHGEGVSASQKYYVDGSGIGDSLSKVTFVPKLGYTGTATITFNAQSASGGNFFGSFVVTIPGSTLTYTSENGEPVCFKASDFTNYSQTNNHGTINYVRFTLPDAKYGTLYYNYIDSDINEGPVSPSTSYKRVGAPYLDKVWFVPNPGFSGNVTINFDYTDVAESTYSGSLFVHVANAAGGGADITYSVRPGAAVWFKVEDFTDFCTKQSPKSTLNYVTFTDLPESSRGTLYCGSKGKVTTTQRINRTGSSTLWLLSDVYFIANTNYSGTVSIPFTASTTDGTVTGTVMITVSADAGINYATGSIITYSSSGEAVTFHSQDFFYDASQHLSQPLSTVRFYTPEVSQGRLCLNYGSPTSYASLDTSKEYPYTETSSIAFQPRAGFTGAAYIHFIGTDQSGKSYSGTLAVNVDPPVASTYFDDLGSHPWAISSVDFLARNNIVSGIAYRVFSPAGQTKRGDFILMLQRCFNFAGGGETVVFNDVSPWSYYGSAISGAYALGLATGDGNGYFRPNATLTRQEAAMFLYRCMKWSGSLQDGTTADLAAFSDRGQISAYAVTAMATLVRLGVLTGDTNGRLNPTQSLTRAEMAVMFHRALT